MIIIFAALAIILLALLVVSVISSSMTTVAMSDALRAQAQATQALAVAEVLREVTALVLVLALLAVIVLAGVIVWRRKPGKVVEIRPRQVVKGDVVERPQLPAGDPMTQLVQLMVIEKIENMRERENRQ